MPGPVPNWGVIMAVTRSVPPRAMFIAPHHTTGDAPVRPMGGDKDTDGMEALLASATAAGNFPPRMSATRVQRATWPRAGVRNEAAFCRKPARLRYVMVERGLTVRARVNQTLVY